eukprot:1191501-Prorocentrum_minimum.AAC.1
MAPRRRYCSLSPCAIGARYGYILSPLLRLVPATECIFVVGVGVAALAGAASGADGAHAPSVQEDHHLDRRRALPVGLVTVPCATPGTHSFIDNRTNKQTNT